MGQKYLVVTYCPATAVGEVIKAMGDAGAGALGAYRYAAFITSGTGNWMDPGATQMTREAEDKIEMVCEEQSLRGVGEAIKRASPYGKDATVQAFPLTLI
jgi:hypothetical protein